MASSINKICVIGQTEIHTYAMSHHCSPKKLRFGAVYGPAASLDRTSSVLIKTGTLLWRWIARLFQVGLLQVYGLCQQASDDSWTSYKYWTWNCSIIDRFMLENRQKLNSASGLLQTCPMWPCMRIRVSFIMTSNVLLQE